mgnify:CR=1 FL=1
MVELRRKGDRWVSTEREGSSLLERRRRRARPGRQQRLLDDRHELRRADHAVPRHPRQRRSREDEVAAGVLRGEGPEDAAIRGRFEGRHEDPVLRRDARRHEARRQQSHDPLRLWGLRGVVAAQLQRHDRCGMARARRRLGARRTCAAAASSGRSGIRRRCARIIRRPSRTSLR